MKNNKLNSQYDDQQNSPLSEGCGFSRGVLSSKSNKKIFNKYKKLPYNPKLKVRAKELRKAGNLSEVLFWMQVKKGKIFKLDFHRQKIIGNYIVDFYCPALDLIVEIDGASHNFKIEYDKKRENYLKSLGLNIIHYDDVEIKRNLNSVIENLKEYCFKLKSERK